MATQFPVASPSWSTGQVPVPDMATAEPPPGVAEKVIWAEPGPAVLGAKTTRTVHEAFATRTVVLDTQSPEFPLSTTKVVPLDFTLICPLVCWPVFVMVKVATLLD
jgi:hypothetical protein